MRREVENTKLYKNFVSSIIYIVSRTSTVLYNRLDSVTEVDLNISTFT